MAAIKHLGTGQEPPPDQDWILVERQDSGTCLVHVGMAPTSGGPLPIRHDGPFRHLSDALEVAHRSAARLGLKTVFVKGLTEA
jgi:hypothetical protein